MKDQKLIWRPVKRGLFEIAGGHLWSHNVAAEKAVGKISDYRKKINKKATKQKRKKEWKKEAHLKVCKIMPVRGLRRKSLIPSVEKQLKAYLKKARKGKEVKIKERKRKEKEQSGSKERRKKKWRKGARKEGSLVWGLRKAPWIHFRREKTAKMKKLK